MHLESRNEEITDLDTKMRSFQFGMIGGMKNAMFTRTLSVVIEKYDTLEKQ